MKSFEVSSRWQFPLYQWYGMGVCCIPSLAPIRGSSFSPMARHCIRSRDQERARVRVNKIFAWFNFRRCARATKIKQREKLKGEVYLTRKFPDLRYVCACTLYMLDNWRCFTYVCRYVGMQYHAVSGVQYHAVSCCMQEFGY